MVDDGSRDDTATVAEEAGADVVVRQSENRGKGAAVRAGMLVARGRTIAFTDADLAYEPVLLLRLLDQVEAGWDVVVGSRARTSRRLSSYVRGASAPSAAAPSTSSLWRCFSARTATRSAV